VILSAALLFSPMCVRCVSMELVPVSSGKLVVYDDSGKERNMIEVGSFLASKFEIARELWKTFAHEMGSVLPEVVTPQTGDDLKDVSPEPRNPIVGVTWYEAIVFCNWLSLRDGLQPAYGYDIQRMGANLRKEVDFPVTWDGTATGYRLPTSAEWPFMATDRSTSRTSYAGSNRVSDVAVLGEEPIQDSASRHQEANPAGHL
jgi:formylglycine-generating enzyme